MLGAVLSVNFDTQPAAQLRSRNIYYKISVRVFVRGFLDRRIAEENSLTP